MKAVAITAAALGCSALLVALAAACGNDDDGATATTGFTPLPPLGIEALDPRAPIDKTGWFVRDVRTGAMWWLRQRSGIWSPVENTLLVTGCCVGQGDIQLIHLPSGDVERVYLGDVASAGWSPDGERIAFTAHREGAGPEGLYVVDRDGGGLRQLSEAGGWSVRWSPDGRFVAYDTAADAYLIELDSGRVRQLAGSGGGLWAWSPDGSLVALSGDAGLRLYDVETEETRQLGREVAGGPVLWSPDGSKVLLPYGPRTPLNYGAFAGTPEAGSRAWHVFAVDGGDPVSLGHMRAPAWSPDSSRIAYESDGCVTGEWEIYVADADGGSPQRLTDTPGAFKEGPAWSPDGSTIAYSAHGALMLMDLETGEEHTLAFAEDGAGFQLHPASWSPDGRYLQLGSGDGHGLCD